MAGKKCTFPTCPLLTPPFVVEHTIFLFCQASSSELKRRTTIFTNNEAIDAWSEASLFLRIAQALNASLKGRIILARLSFAVHFAGGVLAGTRGFDISNTRLKGCITTCKALLGRCGSRS